MQMGDLLVRTMLSTSHMGVVEKTHAGFTQLCRRVMRADAPAVRALPAQWLEVPPLCTEARC
jgi:hypothetical protein